MNENYDAEEKKICCFMICAYILEPPRKDQNFVKEKYLQTKDAILLCLLNKIKYSALIMYLYYLYSPTWFLCFVILKFQKFLQMS